MRSFSFAIIALGGCAGSPNTVEVELAPAVISSLDATLTISAIVAANTTPLDHEGVHVAVDYTDRNGTPHAIEAVDGKTDARGVFTAVIKGLEWDGTGKVTVSSGPALGAATFAVLDRTPPKIQILPPTTDLRVGPGLPLDVQVHVTDEIGVSQVILDDGGGFGGGGRTAVLVNGTQDQKVTFRINVPAGAQAGQTLALYALATDLSGNTAVATSVKLTVDPTISIATPPGLVGTLLVDGTAQRLVNPRSIVFSPKDSHLYVADVAGVSGCTPSCVWRVDPTNGAIDAVPIYTGLAATEGVAVDANGDHLYISDRQNRVVQLAWNGTAYATPVVCDNVAAQRPQDPYHLVVDPTLGILAVDGGHNEVERLATCAVTTTGTAASMNGSFDSPRGIALGANGEIYVSDNNRDEVARVDRTTGAVSVFERDIAAPYGMEWLAGGTSPYANTLLVASGDRVVHSTTGAGPLAVAYLRNAPIDLSIANSTLFILTTPGNGNRGRIFQVTGF